MPGFRTRPSQCAVTEQGPRLPLIAACERSPKSVPARREFDQNLVMGESQERWGAIEEVLAVCARYEAAIPGWKCPPLYGLGLRRQEQNPLFPFVCHGDHPLPAVVLATVLGHGGGTRSYELTLKELDQAIDLLAPAEACRDFTHPNLVAWRTVRNEAVESRNPRIFAVFDADPESATNTPDVLAIREAGRTP